MIRLPGQGEANANGGPPGDCYCFIQVREHPLFRREGQNLICALPLSYSQAALGAQVQVPTLEGTEEVAIERGVPIGGKDFKTGQTLLKTVLSPMFKARMLGVSGWYSTKIGRAHV